MRIIRDVLLIAVVCYTKITIFSLTPNFICKKSQYNCILHAYTHFMLHIYMRYIAQMAMPTRRKNAIIEPPPAILLKRSGAITEMHKPIIRNDAGVVDGSTAKHAAKISTRICNIFHISREMSEIDSRSLWYMSDVHI